jgi:hypothetical protein
VNKQLFLKNAKPLKVMVGARECTANPEAFGTGSVGYKISEDFSHTMPDGQVVVLQVRANLIAAGSKSWA